MPEVAEERLKHDGDSAAKHENIGVDQIHDVAEPESEELDGFLYSVPGDEAPLHYIVFSDDPPALVAKLRAQEVGAALQYRFLAEHPPYAKLNDDDFLGARSFAHSAVYLPFGLALSEDDARRIGRTVKGAGVPIKRWPG